MEIRKQFIWKPFYILTIDGFRYQSVSQEFAFKSIFTECPILYPSGSKSRCILKNVWMWAYIILHIPLTAPLFWAFCQ